MKSDRRYVKRGDVVAIPLPGIGKVAYARVYDEGAVGVYAELRDPGEPPPVGLRRFLFQVGVDAHVLRSAAWPKVGSDPFAQDEDPWPAPRFVQDKLDGTFQRYHRGVLSPAARSEVVGLEPVAAWDRNHVEDRIVAAYRGQPQPWVGAPWEVPVLDLSGPPRS